jgi:hypothetical protein
MPRKTKSKGKAQADETREQVKVPYHGRAIHMDRRGLTTAG